MKVSKKPGDAHNCLIKLWSGNRIVWVTLRIRPDELELIPDDLLERHFRPAVHALLKQLHAAQVPTG